MDKFKHQIQHVKWHEMLDCLVADFFKDKKKPLSETSVMELLAWSYEQKLNPTEVPPNLVFDS